MSKDEEFTWLPHNIHELDDMLQENCLYTVDLDTSFRGETIFSTEQLDRKLSSLFKRDIYFNNTKVTRTSNSTTSHVVMDKCNFINMVYHNNYGDFDNDYCLQAIGFFHNGPSSTEARQHPTTPAKLVQQFAEKEEDMFELTITIRRGEDNNDAPARGLTTYNLMKDPMEVTRVIEHFNLMDKANRISMATPSIPTLQVRLKEPVTSYMENDAINTEPLMIYDPTPQRAADGNTELWAHLQIKHDPTKKITFEGIAGRTDLEEIKHRLSYHGEIVSDFKPEVWSAEGFPQFT